MTRLAERRTDTWTSPLPRIVWRWWDRILAWRDRILSSPRFQRWAARFPLTRGVAQRRAAGLFDLCAGFVYSQVLLACVRLRLLETLAERPQTPAELASRVSLSLDATVRLLEAAVSLRLVERRSAGRYGLGMHGASYMGNPGLGPMIEHHALFYRDLEDPVALLRGEETDTELHRFWSYAGAGPGPASADSVEAYSTLMASSQAMLAKDIVEAYPLGDHRVALDVGGGEGAFLTEVAARAPHLSLRLFDLPPVADRARRHFETAGLGERVEVRGGDVFRDPLPGPVDLVSLVRVLHDHDDEAALAILRAAHRALAPGGKLLVAEPMRDHRGSDPAAEAYFGFYLLAMGQGRPRSAAELEELLRAAGFGRVQVRQTRRPMLTRLVIASRTASV